MRWQSGGWFGMCEWKEYRLSEIMEKVAKIEVNSNGY